MQCKLNSVILMVVVGIVCLALPANSQNTLPAPLDEQLKAQYTTISTCGANGTVLVVQKGGLVGGPQAISAPTSKYQDGKLHPPSSNIFNKVPGIGPFSRVPQTYQQVTRPFGTGLKVYPTTIQVNLTKDAITMGILACDTNLKSSVLFQFSKGTLQKMGVPEVIDVISQVLAFDQPAESAASAQNTETEPVQPSSPDPPAEGPKIQIGETIDQVIAAFGQPEKKVDLGSKQIFMYKNLKVTFQDGKVSGAE